MVVTNFPPKSHLTSLLSLSFALRLKAKRLHVTDIVDLTVRPLSFPLRIECDFACFDCFRFFSSAFSVSDSHQTRIIFSSFRLHHFVKPFGHHVYIRSS